MGAYFPKTFAEYVGQSEAVELLQMKAEAARVRRKCMGHTLIYSGFAGVGKTALARLVAQELGGDLFVQTEPLTPRKVPFLFTNLQEGDVLFFDELHKQFPNKANAEWLLQYLDRGVIPSAVGEIEAPAVTVIGATTDVGSLTEPYRSRFEITIELQPYDDEDATKIALQLARTILEDNEGLPVPTLEVCAAVARATNNIPREMTHILENIRDLVLTKRTDVGILDGDYELGLALKMAGYTPDGLDPRDQKYLRLLYSEFQGEPAGERVLKSRLRDASGLSQTENRLADKGYIVMTKSGRLLTPAGIKRTQRLVAA